MHQTVGVDLAVQPRDTAICVVTWDEDDVRAEFVETPGDEELAAHLGAHLADPTVTHIGIDVPLGWPQDFARAINGYMSAPSGSWIVDGRSFAEASYFRLRETDRHVVRRFGGRQTPLSVTSDRIGAVAMKAAWLLTLLAEEHEVDRAGVTGKILEVYPAAALRAWNLGLPHYRQLKRRDWPGAERRILEVLQHHGVPTGTFPEGLLNEHQFDAFICAVIAEARQRHQTELPTPAVRATAQLEGWIHVPVEVAFAEMFSTPGPTM